MRGKGQEAGIPEVVAYRGYLIRYRALDGLFYISKGKAHISCAKSMEAARSEVDLVA